MSAKDTRAGGPAEPRPSAVVVLLDDQDRVYLVERPKASRFFPGHHAFPGGAVEPEHDGEPTGPEALEAYRACAARELEEEVLVRIDADALRPAGITVTPPFSPIRYRTQFFLAALPAGAEAEAQAPELAGGAWFDPAAALKAWRGGDLRLPPPVIHVLEVLAERGPEALARKGTERARVPITFATGVRLEPLEVGTLPPHTHTNAFIVGTRELAVVDPGADGEALEPLLETLDGLTDDGRDGAAASTVRYVVLTHHHEDHVAGVDTLLDRYGAELACSLETGRLIGREPERTLADGDRLTLGDVDLVALATPGHAPGHLAFHVPQAHTVLAGDLVAGVGTVIIAPGEGDMAAYLASLDRLAAHCEAHGVRLLFPAHGPPAFHPANKLLATRQHRLDREARVLAAVHEGPSPVDLATVAARAYADTPGAPEALTRLSARAHLDKLVADGAVRSVEGQATDDGPRGPAWAPGRPSPDPSPSAD